MKLPAVSIAQFALCFSLVLIYLFFQLHLIPKYSEKTHYQGNSFKEIQMEFINKKRKKDSNRCRFFSSIVTLNGEETNGANNLMKPKLGFKFQTFLVCLNEL
jgi:hypothetical protein